MEVCAECDSTSKMYGFDHTDYLGAKCHFGAHLYCQCKFAKVILSLGSRLGDLQIVADRLNVVQGLVQELYDVDMVKIYGKKAKEYLTYKLMRQF